MYGDMHAYVYMYVQCLWRPEENIMLEAEPHSSAIINKCSLLLRHLSSLKLWTFDTEH